MQLINKYASESEAERIIAEPQPLSEIELFANAKEEQVDGYIVNKKIFDLSNGKLLVRVCSIDSCLVK